MFAGGHDQWSVNFLEECVCSLQLNPSLSLAYTQVDRIDGDGNVVCVNCTGDKWNAVSIDVVERARLFLWKRKSCIMMYGVYRFENIKYITIKKILEDLRRRNE